MFVLLFVALWFILRGDLLYVLPCVILFLCFSVLLEMRLPRLGNSAFRTFVRFVLVWICRFPLPLGVWEGLRFVIVALPGIFSNLLFYFIFFFTVWEDMSFKEFQNGHHGGHLGYRSGTILAILNLCVTAMPPIKFWLKPTYGLGGDVVRRISRWPPWRSSLLSLRNDFSNS